MIHNLTELAAYVGATEPTSKSIERALFDGSDSGVMFASTFSGVSVKGYCEGESEQCPWHNLAYPFSEQEFDEARNRANQDANDLWG